MVWVSIPHMGTQDPLGIPKQNRRHHEDCSTNCLNIDGPGILFSLILSHPQSLHDYADDTIPSKYGVQSSHGKYRSPSLFLKSPENPNASNNLLRNPPLNSWAAVTALVLPGRFASKHGCYLPRQLSEISVP